MCLPTRLCLLVCLICPQDKLPEVHLKYALLLEDEGRFKGVCPPPLHIAVVLDSAALCMCGVFFCAFRLSVLLLPVVPFPS
jgi:hypothetical protein